MIIGRNKVVTILFGIISEIIFILYILTILHILNFEKK